MPKNVLTTNEVDADIAEETFPSMYQAMIQGAQLAGEPLMWKPNKDKPGEIDAYDKDGDFRGSIFEENN